MRAARALLVLLLLLAPTGADAKARSSSKRRKRRTSRTWKVRIRECEEGACAHLIAEEGMNCVHRCASAACYDEVYAAEPLEDGEVDTERDALFKSCMVAEAKAQRQQGGGKAPPQQPRTEI